MRKCHVYKSSSSSVFILEHLEYLSKLYIRPPTFCSRDVKESCIWMEKNIIDLVKNVSHSVRYKYCMPVKFNGYIMVYACFSKKCLSLIYNLFLVNRIFSRITSMLILVKQRFSWLRISIIHLCCIWKLMLAEITLLIINLFLSILSYYQLD